MKVRTGQTASQTGSADQVVAQVPSAIQAKPAAVVSADQLAQAGQGAPVSLAQLGAPEQLAVGRGGAKGGSAKPSTRLTPAQIDEVSGVGGVGIKGRGRLSGEIEHRGGAFVLVTRLEGSRSEVQFKVDMPQKDLKKLEGEKVAIEGMIEKQAAWGGKVTGAKFSAVDPAVKVGGFEVLSGKIENRSLMGIGGEAPPSGSYLKLNRPIRVGGRDVKELFLEGPELRNGASVKLHGRIDERSWGGVATPGTKYLALTGVSNEKAGEPRYVNGEFKTKRNAVLDVLSYNRPMMYDAPARIFVLDGDKAFLGGIGGHIPPQRNPFHGFSGSAKIETPTAAERRAVKFSAEGAPLGKDGQPMDKISPDEGRLPGADRMTQTWYFDEGANKAYRFDNGGIAGFRNQMSAVINAAQ